MRVGGMSCTCTQVLSDANRRWLEAVEGFFADLTRRRLRRDIFRSVIDDQAAINRYIAAVNGDVPISVEIRGAGIAG